MKLIKQIRLEFRAGTSDKVYEVDLCEVGPGQFVVNFRYGRRGSNLRDGSKTPAPVTRAKADQIYDDLVASKIKEGYWDASGPVSAAPPTAPAQPATPAAPAPTATDPREQGVLNRLALGFAALAPSRGKKGWRLSRAIWRAGELGLRSAEPLLLQLLDQTRQNKEHTLRQPRSGQFDRNEVEQLLGRKLLRLPPASYRWGHADWSESFAPPEDMFFYVLAWSLGRCGSRASVAALQDLRTETWEPIGRVATAALLMVLQGDERASLVEELTETLPSSLRGPCRSGPAEAFDAALQDYLKQDSQPSPFLDLLYLIDNAHVRPALLTFLRGVPLHSAAFQAVRHIFKLAEMRRDAEVFGLIAYRLETTSARVGSRLQVPVNRYSGGAVTKATAFVFPYRDSTRLYLRTRAWRTLRKLGEVGHGDYVNMATGVLLQVTDDDAKDAEVWSHQYQYDPRTRRHRQITRHRDCFGRFWAFNHILYNNSPRYEPVQGKAFFSCVGGYKPGDPEPAGREEAFPDVWQAAPDAVLYLLERSRCEPVHRFGVKVLRACPDFCARLDVPRLVKLLEVPYEVTVELALDLALKRYDPKNPDLALVLALANSGLDRARRQARTWIDQDRGAFTRDAAFLASLAASPQADTRSHARDLLRQTAADTQFAEALVARLIAMLRSFKEGEGERARDTAQTLLLVFAAPLRRVGVDVIRDLLGHPLAEVRQFAGELVLGHETLANRPPEDVLLKLLRDPEATVRGVGVRLLGQLPDEALKKDVDLLVGLVRHELPDFRENIRPVVRRLAAADPAFGRAIAEKLVEAILTPGAPEGIPSHTARVLREDLRDYLDRVTPETVFKLLQSRSGPAQEVGGLLLATNVKSSDLGLAEIVKLASHEVLAVREASWRMCRDSRERFKQDMSFATTLVDAKWEDSRKFAFGFLRDEFDPGELTPAVLVSLCDSVRPDVQAFGREMITRLFAEQDGPEYALKLSEHPSPSMQMFSATFLERYAGDSVERLRELSWYFKSVLSRVNQGRVAKERVFNFLDTAARRDAESAAVVAEILGRQSATAAVGDRARAIEIMTRIHAAYPAVAMPLTVRPVEVRNGETRAR